MALSLVTSISGVKITEKYQISGSGPVSAGPGFQVSRWRNLSTAAALKRDKIMPFSVVISEFAFVSFVWQRSIGFVKYQNISGPSGNAFASAPRRRAALSSITTIRHVWRRNHSFFGGFFASEQLSDWL
jgi:hypothetical protein